ncbi:MAG TPA: AarF/UbiB family protein [Polyangia bacterium]|jgi:ubiquinone biosynthesis protein
MASIINTVRDMERLRQITVVLLKHGFGDLVQRLGLSGGEAKPEAGAEQEADQKRKRITFGERLRLVLQDLGPSFVKLGQIISTRPDIIPPDVVVELKKLQDEVPPVPFDEVKADIESSLGGPIDEVFAEFGTHPIASASIAQVYRAKLKVAPLPASGDGIVDVAVKVQRPKIRGVVERDLDLLYFLARLIEKAVPESRIYAPTGLVSEFDRAITAELDFTNEADNGERFARNFEGIESIRFPKVYRQASSKRILTLEFIDGKKVYAAVKSGFSGEKIAKTAVNLILKMIYGDGFFHADPHPGNIFIVGTPEQPVIVMLDLGLVGRLSPEMREKTVDLMIAIVREDLDAMAEAFLAIGRPGARVDRAAFKAEVQRIGQKFVGKPLKEIELAALIRDLVEGAIKFDIEIPPDFLMMGKSLMTIEGIGKELYPDLDVVAECRPFFMRLLQERYSPVRLSENLLRGLGRLSTAASGFPMQVQDILEDIRRGNLSVKTVDPGLPKIVDRLGRRIFSAVVIIGLLGCGTALVLGHHYYLGGIAWFLAGTLFFWHWALDLWKNW